MTLTTGLGAKSILGCGALDVGWQPVGADWQPVGAEPQWVAPPVPNRCQKDLHRAFSWQYPAQALSQGEGGNSQQPGTVP